VSKCDATLTLAALAEGIDEAAGASGAGVRAALADVVAGRAELALAVAGGALVVPGLQQTHAHTTGLSGNTSGHRKR
jgi:hypothetical protein